MAKHQNTIELCNQTKDRKNLNDFYKQYQRMFKDNSGGMEPMKEVHLNVDSS